MLDTVTLTGAIGTVAVVGLLPLLLVVRVHRLKQRDQERRDRALSELAARVETKWGTVYRFNPPLKIKRKGNS